MLPAAGVKRKPVSAGRLTGFGLFAPGSNKFEKPVRRPALPGWMPTASNVYSTTARGSYDPGGIADRLDCFSIDVLPRRDNGVFLLAFRGT